MLTITPINFVTNTPVTYFYPFVENKNTNQVFSKLVVW